MERELPREGPFISEGRMICSEEKPAEQEADAPLHPYPGVAFLLHSVLRALPQTQRWLRPLWK